MHKLVVWKFGGASVKNPEAIRNVLSILKKSSDDNIVIVISAMDKTTNKLEAILNSGLKDIAKAKAKIEKSRQFHLSVATDLVGKNHPVIEEINSIFNELETNALKADEKNYDRVYDEVISNGEILSTRIIAAFINASGISCHWQDARTLIKTDDLFRSANVDWQATQNAVNTVIPKKLEENSVVITLGFIGSSTENQTTTLGREGSDFTAAILAFCLDATELTIWKDVPGILTADPRKFKNVTKLDRISYREAIEMTFYGAKVLHPKTIKPIQNKSISLTVKPFNDPSAAGTLISNESDEIYPPIVTIEDNQALLHISSKDFSFVAEHHISRLFGHIADIRIQVNMIQNTAISFTLCVNDDSKKIEQFISLVQDQFNVLVEQDLSLISVRHYNKPILKKLMKNKIIKLEMKLRDTAQLVVKPMQILEEK